MRIEQQETNSTHFLLCFTAFFVFIASFFFSLSKVHAGTIGKPPYLLTLKSGLVGHWTFDGKDFPNGKALDISGNGNHGSPANIATSTFYAAGKIGQGVSFDGVNDYIDVGNITNADNQTSMTVSAWFKTTTTPNSWGEIIVGKLNASGGLASGAGWAIFMGGSFLHPNRIGATIQANGSNYRVRYTSATYSDNNWHHAVMVVSGGNTVAVYVDGTVGTLTNDGGTVTTYSSTGNVRIGGDNTSGDEIRSFVDDVRIYNRVLSASEIAQLYNLGAAKLGITKTPDPLKSGLVGHWTFDGKDFPNGKALDISGNGNHGSPTNIATSTFYVPGKIGQGVKFDDVNDYINAGTGADLTGAVTVAAWVKGINTTSDDFIVGRGNTPGGGSSTKQFGLYLSDAQRVGFQVSNGTSILNSAGSANNLPNGEWKHVVGTYDGVDTTKLFIDGIEVDTDTSASFGSLNSAAIGLGIGSRQTGGTIFFGGLLDDVRIYNRVLSASEITQLYNIGAAKVAVTKTPDPLTSGLVGHWTFDGKDFPNGKALDISGNGNHGSPANIATSTFYVPGKIGQGGNFDGINDYVDLGTTINPSAVTMNIWVKATSLGKAYQDALTRQNVGGSIFSEIAVKSTGKLALYLRASGGSVSYDGTGTYTLTTGNWYMLTLVYDSTVGLIGYVNGEVDRTVSANGTVNTTALQTTIGRAGAWVATDNYWTGMLDDARIYNRALSAAEVKQLYNLGR